MRRNERVVGHDGPGAADPPAILAKITDGVEGHRVAQGHVDRAIHGFAHLTAGRRFGRRDIAVRTELREVWLGRDESDCASHGARSVERALGPAQDLDALKIEQIRIDRTHPESRDRCLIQIVSGRLPQLRVSRRNATHNDVIFAWTGGAER